MFETIDRTRSGTSDKFWQGIKQSNGTPPETIIGKCARSTNVYMRDNTILACINLKWLVLYNC